MTPREELKALEDRQVELLPRLRREIHDVDALEAEYKANARRMIQLTYQLEAETA